MILNSKIKLKPFKNITIPADIDVQEYHIFYELFPGKRHSVYGMAKETPLSTLGLFSDTDREMASLLYPEWDNTLVYFNSQKNTKENTITLNIYLFEKQAILSSSLNNGVKDIVLNPDYIFKDEHIGKNKGILVDHYGRLSFFQNKRECDEYIRDSGECGFILFENVAFHKIGDKILLDIPRLEFHSEKDYVKRLKTYKSSINIFLDESSMYHLISEKNKEKPVSLHDDPENYNVYSLSDLREDGGINQHHCFINQNIDCFKISHRYQAFMDYERPVWLVKEEVRVGSLVSHVLFLFRTIEAISDLPEATLE